MKVLFQSRTNLFDAPGGDMVQMLKTKEFLEKLGVEIDISLDFEPDLSNYDLVHLFNLMEPQDIYLQMLNAKNQNKKIVLSTIYGLYTEFERNARGGMFQKLANIISPYQINYIKGLVKHYYEKRFHKGVFKMIFKGYYGLMNEIVQNTSIFLPNSISEMNRVVNEFNLKNYKFVDIPNAIDKSVFSEKSSLGVNKFAQYQDCIVCAARIEGRKATLNLVRAVKNSSYKLVLVGKESQNQLNYVKQVRHEAGKNVVFLGAIPHEDLRDLYKVAKVHALVSWMETPGLSSLEAAAMGCNIVATKKGDPFDYFGDLAFYCEPDNVDSIKKAIDLAFESKVNPELKKKVLENYIWEKTALETLKGYKTALEEIS
ncbi:MAG: glycosyltransferase family 4 protein [Flavobacterium sp.]|nr:glycosyltransferase family 4 protein [Flavobacterium sp.]